MSEDATSKKFLVSLFNNYKMVDGRPIMEQFYEVEDLYNSFNQYGLHMDETIVVPSVIDKLPPSWKEIKKGLKHRKEDMTLEDLANHLRIEEEYRRQDDGKEHIAENAKIHAVEEEKSTKKRSGASFIDKKNKKRHATGCWSCGKPGHMKKDCRYHKNKDGGTAKKNFVAMILEANILEDDAPWWIDSGATKHVCKDKKLFKTYEPVEEGTNVYMGNSSIAQVQGKGTIVLEFTSSKTLSLRDVYHVPEVRKNLVSGSILDRHGFKLVFESRRFVLSKGGVFVGKGYMCEGIFKMNINK